MHDTIDEISWSDQTSGTGRATRVPEHLRQLTQADQIGAVDAIHALLDDIWADGEVFPATTVTIPLLCEFLAPPVGWLQPKITLILGVLAEGRSSDTQTQQNVRVAIESQLDTYLALAGVSDGSAAMELALLYLLAHFPRQGPHIHAAIDFHRWTQDDAARLERCLATPDFADPATIARIGRSWPTPAIWALRPGEDVPDRQWKASLNLGPAEAARIWDLETQALLAYLGAQAEHAVKEASGVR